jgi:hypothetical protein
MFSNHPSPLGSTSHSLRHRFVSVATMRCNKPLVFQQNIADWEKIVHLLLRRMGCAVGYGATHRRYQTTLYTVWLIQQHKTRPSSPVFCLEHGISWPIISPVSRAAERTCLVWTLINADKSFAIVHWAWEDIGKEMGCERNHTARFSLLTAVHEEASLLECYAVSTAQ